MTSGGGDDSGALCMRAAARCRDSEVQGMVSLARDEKSAISTVFGGEVREQRNSRRPAILGNIYIGGRLLYGSIRIIYTIILISHYRLQ